MARNGRPFFQFLSPFNPRQHGGWTGWSEGGLRPPAAARGASEEVVVGNDFKLGLARTRRLTRTGVKIEHLYTGGNLLPLMLSGVDSH